MINSPLRIRLLTEADISFADSLRAAENWNQTQRDWQRLLAHQPDGCFLATWNDQPAGVVTTTVHESTLGWIGMMLVRADLRRRGIATALIERALDYLTEHRVTCIKLDATPAGAPVYERLGFKTEWSWQRRSLQSEHPTRIKITGCNDLPRCQLDTDAFGADRHVWLSRVATDANVILHDDGYGMLRQGSSAGYVGPIVAGDEQVAEQIIGDLLPRLEGNCLWDLPSQNRHGIELAESMGFRPIRDLNRMWTGDRLISGRPEKQYGFVDPGTG